MITRVLSLVFGLVSAVCLFITLYLVITTLDFINHASIADGTAIGQTNTNPNARSAAIIQFLTSDGQRVNFTTGVNSNPPEFQVGQRVRVYYNLADPVGTARADSSLSLWLLPTICGGVGIVFGVIGLSFFVVSFMKHRKQRWLRRYGQVITAKVTDVRRNTAIRNRGKSPVIITAQWLDPLTSVSHIFVSDFVWDDPLILAPGDTVSVLLDPKDYRRYYFGAATLSVKEAAIKA